VLGLAGMGPGVRRANAEQGLIGCGPEQCRGCLFRLVAGHCMAGSVAEDGIGDVPPALRAESTAQRCRISQQATAGKADWAAATLHLGSGIGGEGLWPADPINRSVGDGQLLRVQVTRGVVDVQTGSSGQHLEPGPHGAHQSTIRRYIGFWHVLEADARHTAGRGIPPGGSAIVATQWHGSAAALVAHQRYSPPPSAPPSRIRLGAGGLH
jgi:hypothetical protein